MCICNFYNFLNISINLIFFIYLSFSNFSTSTQTYLISVSGQGNISDFNFKEF